MRNLQEQVKKAFCYQKLFWPFTVWINCSSDLKKFANSQPSASNFKSFSRSPEHFFLKVGQNNFDNKISLYFYFPFLWGLSRVDFGTLQVIYSFILFYWILIFSILLFFSLVLLSNFGFFHIFYIFCQRDCLINSFTGSLGWNRQHHGQTIHPKKKIFNEFVKNLGMIIFDLRGYGGC